MPTLLLDGRYKNGVYVGRPRIEYPFQRNGDFSTILIRRRFTRSLAHFIPGKLTCEKDPQFSDVVLIEETAPEPLQIGDLVQVQRTFARVPTTQTDEGTVMVNRPDPGLSSYPGVLGSYRVFQPDTTLERYDAYAAQTVTSDTGAPSFYPTGGTYTLTFDGDTTSALNYNDSAGTVQTALNALTSVTDRGGLTVSGTYNSAGGFTVTFNSYAACTRTSSLTCSSVGYTTQVNSTTVTNSGYTQTVYFRIYNSVAPFDEGVINGGSFTLTIFGQTTAAINYNDTKTTLQNALNALSEVTDRGGCVVTLPASHPFDTINNTGAAGGILFTISFTNAAFTSNAGSLTPAPASITTAVTDAGVGVTHSIKFAGGSATRTIYCAGHGLSTSDTLYIKGGSTYYSGISGVFALPDANTITITVAASASYASAATITEVGKRTKANYTPGSSPTLCSRVTRFSTSAITPDTFQGDNATFLLAIFSGSTAINYIVGDSTRWPSEASAIYSQTTTKLSAANL